MTCCIFRASSLALIPVGVPGRGPGFHPIIRFVLFGFPETVTAVGWFACLSIHYEASHRWIWLTAALPETKTGKAQLTKIKPTFNMLVW